MENFDHILLFKTNCKDMADKLDLQFILEKQEGIEEWNLDLFDSDFVLRIISYSLSHNSIIELLNQHGYECCELV